MAKIINSLVLFSFLFGLINCYGGTPTLSRKANVRPMLREQTTVIQTPVTQYETQYETQPVETTTFTFPQQQMLVQQELPTVPTGGYSSQQTISRDSLRKTSSGLKKVLQKETATTQTSSGYGLTPTFMQQVPVSVPVPTTPKTVPTYGLTPQITRERPIQKETTTFIQTPTGYSTSQQTQQTQQQQHQLRTQSTISKGKNLLKINKPLLREQTFVNQYQTQQQLPTTSQVLTPVSTMEVSQQTKTLTMCSENPCLNEASCVETQTGFSCQCPWGWSGQYCEICITDCASNPCGTNKKCRAFFGGGYECICPSDRTGANCEIQNDLCSLNPCLNGGVCKGTTEGQYQCTCQMPFAGLNCESEWNNPCTAEVLRNTDVIQFENPWDRTKYIICTDLDQWLTMSCSEGTLFESTLGHCVPEGYEAPMCPPKFCLNDGECMTNEITGELGCTCKSGFTGKNCEVNIDECQLYGNPCGSGQCVDQINTYYCYCPDGGIGLDCKYTIPNPCTPENLAIDSTFFTILSADGDHYLRCSDVNSWSVHRCAQGLFWDQQEKTCTIEKPADLSGQCVDGPCKNAGTCMDLGSSFKCMCKEGYAGDLCEQIIDYCESSPCMNGGRCLPYAGGYTCVCPDKIIDDCCCNGLINPCPLKEKLIPGVNNYYPHIFPHKYIHCDFDGRAFVRNCAIGTKWSQEALSCLPDDFILNTTTTIVEVPTVLPTRQQTQTTIDQSYTQQLPTLTQTINTQRVKLIQKEQPKFFHKQQTTTTFVQKPVETQTQTQTTYSQLPVLTQTVPQTIPVQQKFINVQKVKPLPVQKQTVTIVQTPRPVQTVQTIQTVQQPTYAQLPQLTQTVPKPIPVQQTFQPTFQPTLSRTQSRVEEVPTSYQTLPTIEKPVVTRTFMETPSGYGQQQPTQTDSSSFEDQTFLDGSEFEGTTDDDTQYTQDQTYGSDDLSDTFGSSSTGFGRQLIQTLPETVQLPVQQQQPLLTQSRTAQRPVVQSTPQRMMTQTKTGGMGMGMGVGRTLTQQPVQTPYRRL